MAHAVRVKVAEPRQRTLTEAAPPWWPPVVCGLAAAAPGVGVAQLLAGLIAPGSAPLIAVGGAFVDHVPPWLKDAAVSAFGTHDKTVLLCGAALVLAVLSGLAGVLAVRRPQLAEWLVLGLGALAALAAATRPNASVLWPLPSVGGAVAAVFALRALGRRAAAVIAVDDPARLRRPGTAARPARREFIRLAAAVAGAGAFAAGVGWWLGRRVRDVAASRAAVRLPAPAQPEPPLPAGVEVGARGVTPFRVSDADFYRIDTALVVPQVRADDWHLRIHGMVDREVRLDWAALLASPLVERDVTLCCVSNEVGGDLIGNARWLGLPLGPLLRQAGPSPDADMVLSTSADGWTCSTPLAVLTDGRDAMLAIGMNGSPLPVEHGFPVRMVVPGLYGYVSATKWVVDLNVTTFARDQGYWTSRGWSAMGPVKTESRIDVPADGDHLPTGQVAVAGVAWAQHRGIEGVEVRVDDGPWMPARLGAEASVDTWRQWVWTWPATAGRHTLQVRATDGTGATQTGEVRPPPPNGATGWHTIEVVVG